MKMLISLMLLSLSIAAHASQDLSKCELLAAGQKAGSVVEKASFSEPVSNPLTGALERTAKLNSLTVVLIEYGETAGINIQDSAKEVFFASEFKGGAMYATKNLTAQVNCVNL